MTVRLTPRRYPAQTVLYGGVTHVHSDGLALYLTFSSTSDHAPNPTMIDLRKIAEIALDELPGAGDF